MKRKQNNIDEKLQGMNKGMNKCPEYERNMKANERSMKGKRRKIKRWEMTGNHGRMKQELAEMTEYERNLTGK